MDEKIPEPLGAAHTDPMGAFPAIRKAIMDNFRRYERASASLIFCFCWSDSSGHIAAALFACRSPGQLPQVGDVCVCLSRLELRGHGLQGHLTFWNCTCADLSTPAARPAVFHGMAGAEI